MFTTKITFAPNPDTANFRSMLKPYPKLEKYWDFEKHDDGELLLLDDESVYMTKSDRLLFRFFKAVWTGSDEDALKFDFVEAAFRLEMKDRQMIANFFISPVAP